MIPEDILFEVIDIFAHEYGWTIEVIQELDMSEICKLMAAIIKRKRMDAQLQTVIINQAIAGRPLDFGPEKPQKNTEEEQLRELMHKIGGKTETE